MKRRCYIQLGRAGDILNILPICKRDFDATGIRPILMVQQDYASFLEGVSYVEPLYWLGRFEDVAGAYSAAATSVAHGDAEIICTQIYGMGLATAQDCSSFLRQSWACVPDAPAWGSLPLVFDRRDPDREQAVIDQVRRGSKKPYIVVALDGISSPFDHGQQLAASLRETLSCDVVNISGFRAPRMFDLLGLLAGAKAIVTVDSGILHLAHAVPQVPVVALVTREPSKWHGSAWRPQHKLRFYYDECPQCFGIIISELSEGGYSPRIIHVYTHLETGASPETIRRNAFAASTWQPEYEKARWTSMPFGDGNLKRSSADDPICDERPIPFMHDVINSAIQSPHRLDDIIAWTNADSCFTPGLTGWIMDAVLRYGAAYTHRWDFHRPLTTPLANESQVRRGEWYPGTDACFFTIGWWKNNCCEYPDMLVGREQNDEVLRQLIKARGGIEIPASIYHEKHPSFWEHHGRRMNGHGNLYNQRLAKAWFLKMGYRPFDSVWWQLEPEPAQRRWALEHVKQNGPV